MGSWHPDPDPDPGILHNARRRQKGKKKIKNRGEQEDITVECGICFQTGSYADICTVLWTVQSLMW